MRATLSTRPLRAAVLLIVAAIALAACNTTAPASSAPSSHASASPSTAPSASAPSASPAAAPQRAAIAAFVSQATSGKLSYGARLVGRSRHSTTTLPIKGSMAVSGADYRMVVDFTFADVGVIRVQHRYVGGTAWVRYGATAWRKVPGFTSDDAMSPFAGIIDAADVTYLKTEGTSAKPLYRVSMSAMFIHPSLIPAVNLTNQEVDRTKLELLIDPQGRPISGEWRLNGTGRVSGQLQEIIIELSVTFSSVGAKISITAP